MSGFRRAFTLIELLVVVAIIALLVSILVPSLQRAKDLAKTIVCGNQEKNQGAALYLYAQEYSGWIPPHQSYFVEPDGHQNWPPWYYYLIQAKVVPYFEIWYTGNTNFNCPLNGKNRWGYYDYTYGLNSFMTDYDSDLGRREGWVGLFAYNQTGASIWSFNLHRAKRPQDMYLVGDANYCRLTIYDPPTSGTIKFRHNRATEISTLFGDGHVTRLREARVTGDPNDVRVPAWQEGLPWYNRP